MKEGEKAFFFYEIWTDFKHFRNAKSTCFSDVWIFIFECSFERVAEILADVFDSDAAHGSDCECSEEGIGFVHGVLSGRDGTFLKVLTPRMARSGWDLA